ncbi:uncharacterized protein LOC110116973 [Athalia rosae]|uniref:uncharacterized protein LOC110116973 n=1 Tax=Athalia rosae TaxID=37344 RepID=UPI002033DE67|nr:uncharacterized protein LOC110116973 [Athalia rosae]
MDRKKKESPPNTLRLPPPTLNLMEQLLLVKMESQDEKCANLSSKRALFLRADSMDSQASTSTFSSLGSNDSNSNSCYCKCDDCLLGICDRFQPQIPVAGRKKVSIRRTFPCTNERTIRSIGSFAQRNVFVYLLSEKHGEIFGPNFDYMVKGVGKNRCLVSPRSNTFHGEDP